MAATALEQSGLKTEDYKWREVKQRKYLYADDSDDSVFVEADFDAPIGNCSFYQVVGVRKPKKWEKINSNIYLIFVFLSLIVKVTLVSVNNEILDSVVMAFCDVVNISQVTF